MVKHHDTLDVSEGEVLRQINNLKDYVTKHTEDIPEKIYKAMTGVSQTFLAFQKGKASPGWAKQLVDDLGNPVWDVTSSEIIEDAVPLLLLQGGGGMMPGDIKFGPESSMITKGMPDIPSIDEMYRNAKSHMEAIDEKNKELASIIGPVALINKYSGGEITLGPFPPYLPLPIPIPSKLITVYINIFLESCRLLVSSNILDVPVLRKILSIVLAFYDIVRGEWKDGVLSFLGFFRSSFVYYGVLGKLMRWMYNLISPDIQNRLEEDMFSGGKSMIIGFWLWVASVVSPLFVRNIINEMIETAKQPLEMINKQIEQIEVSAQKAAAPIGARVTFPRVPLNQIPSFDDIQNFQSIVHRPEVVCNPAFQQAIAPALGVPILRLVLELLNVPITPEKIAEKCSGQPASLSEAITKTLTPTVVIPQVPMPQVPMPQLPTSSLQLKKPSKKK
jgi:hypothetical protein